VKLLLNGQEKGEIIVHRTDDGEFLLSERT